MAAVAGVGIQRAETALCAGVAGRCGPRLSGPLAAGITPGGRSPESATADGSLVLVAFDPDVTVGWLPTLVAEGAIDPRLPTTREELDVVRAILAGTPQP